jgi:multidrug efflux pump subunit AcrA (membrane-fusion protein)
MRTTVILALAYAACAAAMATSAESTAAAPDGQAHIGYCLVELMDEARVAAQEAGVLTGLEAREGLQVTKDTELGQINDNKIKMQRSVAEAERDVAKMQAENRSAIDAAEAGEKTALAEWRMNYDAERNVAGSVVQAQLNALALAHREASLTVVQRKMEQKIAGATVGVREVELKAVDEDIDRHKIRSPIDGEIVEVFTHVGEWVNPGDPVFRVVRLDRLKVKGFVNVADFAPDQIAGRPVTVTVKLERGRTEQFEGKIVFVSPLVNTGGTGARQNDDYLVQAEVVNRRDSSAGQWLLRPGLPAEMTIQVNAPTTASSPAGIPR